MNIITKDELMNINGGISKLVKGIGFGILAIGVFVGSVIYGYIHPVKCK